jgi:hypothetical protein
MHHPRRVERMRSFAPVLQDHDFRLIVDPRNRGAMTISPRPKASKTTAWTRFHDFDLGNF